MSIFYTINETESLSNGLDKTYFLGKLSVVMINMRNYIHTFRTTRKRYFKTLNNIYLLNIYNISNDEQHVCNYTFFILYQSCIKLLCSV